MNVVVTQVDNPLRMWPTNTRLYVDGDGQHYVVHVDAGLSDGQEAALNAALDSLGQPVVRSGMHTIVLCDSTILACDENGIAADLTPLHSSPAGTSHEDTLAAAGFEITEGT